MSEDIVGFLKELSAPDSCDSPKSDCQWVCGNCSDIEAREQEVSREEVALSRCDPLGVGSSSEQPARLPESQWAGLSSVVLSASGSRMHHKPAPQSPRQ